jgi:FKBP-type peptidyl-prolyl cis-trans isomerase (trigger factor)
MAVQKSINKDITSTIARGGNGSIQITFTIPWEVIKKSRKEAIIELGRDIEIPGFRKGRAPQDKVQEQIPQNSLLEKTLGNILPKAFTDTVVKEKIKPGIFPKFEILKKDEGSDWQVRAQTAELPEINLGDYRKIISESGKVKNIWTPQDARGKSQVIEKPKEPTREEKEQLVIKLLLENIKLEIPNILIEEEVNVRLSRLLARIEKLGLTLDGYLSSINKNIEALRSEYNEQVKQSIALELILSKIAEEEKLVIGSSQIEAAINATSSDPKLKGTLSSPEQRRIIESILKRRAALEILVKLM